MKLKFIDPDQIMGAVVALIILGVGVFASFTVFANIPITTPVASNARLGNGTLYDAAVLEFNGTSRWIPTPGFLNNTGVCVLWGHGGPGGAGGFATWHVLQTVGACNGTFISNGTYRLEQPGYHNHNNSIRLEYPLSGQQTSSLSNASYYSVINVSATSSQVFNIIGVVLIIAAIMSIVALVYSYIKPKM